MRRRARRLGGALVLALTAAVAAACGDDAEPDPAAVIDTQPAGPSGTPVQRGLPPRLPIVVDSPESAPPFDRPPAPRSADGIEGWAVPSVYRIRVVGYVSAGSGTADIDVEGWMLVDLPYETTGASGNDTNLVEVGIRTDPSPILGEEGALWFGTNTSMVTSLNIPSTTAATAVDIVTTVREDDVLWATLVPGVARISTFNIYNVTQSIGAQVHNVLAGTVGVRFAPDGSWANARVDVGGSSGSQGPGVTSEYHADIYGQRYRG